MSNPPVTEVCFLPLQPGADVENPSSPTGIILADALKTVQAQPGYQRAYSGRSIESPDRFYLLVDWETITSHHNFMASPTYGPFVAALGPLVSGPPTVFHAAFKPSPPTPAVSNTSSPVTEVVTFYLPASTTAAQKESWDKDWAAFSAEIAKADGVAAGMIGGWVVEEQERADVEGGKAIAFQGVIGWQSVEAHLKYKETDAFKKYIAPLREQWKSVDLYHVSFTQH
ncbi:MAG: hypothetical protein M1819_002716 [Sarea resinae]|nr:MAG: hypothetical protein M1819_002716 [Sarea resinae]